MSFTTNDWDAERERHIAEHHHRRLRSRVVLFEAPATLPNNVVDLTAVRIAKRGGLRLVAPTHHDGGSAA